MGESTSLLNLRGWVGRRRSMLLFAGWALARMNTAACSVDLRESNLTLDEAERLVTVLRGCKKLTSIDVRCNETMGMKGVRGLIDLLFEEEENTHGDPLAPKARRLISLCGLGNGRNSLEIPRR